MPVSRLILPSIPIISSLLASTCAQVVNSSSTSAVLPLTAAYYGNTFNAEVTLGDQSFLVLIDTGSADVWVSGEGWKCKRAGASSKAGCEYGNQTYDPSTSSTFQPVDYAWLGEHYGTGDVVGPLGTEDVRLGNITIPDQIFGVVNTSTNIGDKVNTGLMGLGYPIIAQAHPINYTAT